MGSHGPAAADEPLLDLGATMRDRSDRAERVMPSLGVFGLLLLAGAILSWVVPVGLGASSPRWPIGPIPRVPGCSVCVAAAVVLAVLLVLLRRSLHRATRARRARRAAPCHPLARTRSEPRSRHHQLNAPTTTFGDVAGVDEARDELQELVEFLRAPARFAAVGARIPRGVLLVGPPGYGKTLLARAVAGEAGVPFIGAGGSEFVELYVGVGAARVRTLFQEARKHAPCIVFVDEIDAVGRRRGGARGVSHEEREQTLNQILVEMDGFDQRTNVIFVAATNRPDVLDPALLRPGRFDRQVHAGPARIPQGAARSSRCIRGVSRSRRDADLRALARHTSGLTGAELENLVNEAAILAARRERPEVGHRGVGRGAGSGRGRAAPQEPHAEPPRARDHRLPRGRPRPRGALPCPARTACRRSPSCPAARWAAIRGCCPRRTATSGRSPSSRRRWPARWAATWPRACIFGEVTTGASNDLQKATEMARRMVCLYGMSERLGAWPSPPRCRRAMPRPSASRRPSVSPEVARAIDEEVRDLLATARGRAGPSSRRRRTALERTAQELIDHETLDGPELLALLGPTAGD